MPIPSSFNDLSETPSSNSPPGSETVGTQANEYFQAAFSFIRQIYDGIIKPIAAVDFNGQKITNLAKGTVSFTSTDAVTGGQLYVPGEVRYWVGTPTEAAVVAAWPLGWHLANGQNGTPDLRDRFIVGAGANYALGALGGVNTNNLNAAQMPSHAHGISDPGHFHPINDGGHSHGVNDPSHSHPLFSNVPITIPGSSVQLTTASANSAYTNSTVAATTGISIQAATSNIGTGAVFTGITATQNSGNGAAIENRPPFIALVPIYFTGT